MENFEYSVQLNDRDWAEFYLTSEECSLTQPSLATTEDQVLSDLEEGESEEGRSIQVRVGPGPIHHIVSCPTRGLPDGPLPIEDVLSGSEDETDLGSVSRFLCNDGKLGVAFSWPPWNQEGQLPSITLGPLESQQRLAGGHTGREVILAAKQGEPEREQQLIKPACSFPPKVAASAVRKEGLKEKIPEDQEALNPSCIEHDHLDTSDPMESPEREPQSRPSCLELSETTEGVPQASSAETQQLPPCMDLTASTRDPEPLGSIKPPGWVPSSVLKHPDPADGLEGKGKELSSTLQAAQFREDPVPTGSDLGLQESLSKRRGERPLKDVRKGNEVAVDPKGERQGYRRKEQNHGNPNEEGPFGQEKHSSQSSGLEQVSRRSSDPRSTQTAEMESGLSGKHGQTLLGTTVPRGEECPPRIQGDQESENFKDSLPYGPPPEGSPESKSTAMTWPEMYDSFFCDDTQKEVGKMGTETRKDNLVADPDQGPPHMGGPEMYEYFFPEMDRAQVGRSHIMEGDRMVDDLFLSSENQPAPPGGPEDPDFGAAEGDTYFSVPEVYEHFFVYTTKGQRNWRGYFLSMPASEAKKAIRAVKSLLRKSARFFKPQPVSHGALLRRSSQGKLVLLTPRLIDESHPRPEELGMALMQPERPLKPVFTHRDMCLGFVAFASWAVKTSDLQAPDAWKIVLLANFGTLSAIRFFRRHVVVEGHLES